MRVRGVTVALLLIAALAVGCGESGSEETGAVTREAPEPTPMTTAPTPTSRAQPEQKSGDAGQQKARKRNPEKVGAKPATKENTEGAKRKPQRPNEQARALRELAQRAARQASEPLTRKELEEIAERAAAQGQDLLPQPGQTPEDAIRELEEAIGREP